MKRSELVKQTIIGVVLFLGVCWSLASAAANDSRNTYPNSEILASAQWLEQNIGTDGVVIVDVRMDKYFDGKVIPGAIRLPWGKFQHNDTASHIGSAFVGAERAQQVLGDHGIMRSDTLVLYDSVERDGGATSSYVFWVLDLLGHENKKILNGGIDAWKASGGNVVTNEMNPEPVLYQADPEELRPRVLADGSYIKKRLGDPYYQIIDVRSRGEYLGEKGNEDLNDQPLKLGHIPTAVNVEYKKAWIDEETKLIKPYEELRELYRGLDPGKGTIVYCHSGRRGSFGYFVLRLMGFSDVIEYEASWNEWGSPRKFFPVELKENLPTSDALPSEVTSMKRKRSKRSTSQKSPARSGETADDVGYVSCGG